MFQVAIYLPFVQCVPLNYANVKLKFKTIFGIIPVKFR